MIFDLAGGLVGVLIGAAFGALAYFLSWGIQALWRLALAAVRRNRLATLQKEIDQREESIERQENNDPRPH